MKMHSLALIGAGSRGWSLARETAQDDRARFRAVVDPVASCREAFAEEFAIPGERCFETHADMLRRCDDLDGVIIASPVRFHVEAACDCLDAGLAVFLEKPMALNLDEARRIVAAADASGARLQVGFNCRYAPFFEKLEEIVAAGTLGQLLSVEWKEAIAPSHYAEYCRHSSYNRQAALGSWLLEKACHDIDLIAWVVGATCVRVASFGSRSHFVPRHDVPEQCSSECAIESECLFAASKLYGDEQSDRSGRTRIMSQVCVYHSGADLLDHQATILEFDNGVTVAFSLLPMTHEESRYVHICGGKATLRGSFAPHELRVYPYDTREEVVCDAASATASHGGADPRVMVAFLDWLDDPDRLPKTTGKDGLEAMVICEGIDRAVRERRVVELEPLRHP